MDAARRAMCLDDPFNPLITTTMQASGILVISHFFHLVLKPLGQPGPVAQILAGIVLSPTLLSRIDKVNEFFIQSTSQDYYEVYQSVFGILFMFLIGLEMDIPYLRRNLRKASIIAYGGVSTCVIFGASISYFIIHLLAVNSNKVTLGNVIIMILANSASPIVIRLAAELKFVTADIGRLAICSSLITEMSCVLWMSLIFSFMSWKMFGKGILFVLLTVALIVLNKYLALWCNQRNRNQKYVTNAEVLIFLFLVIALSFLIEKYGYNSTISCFFIGLMFPREGKTTRTLLRKLTYATYNFIFPIYFGYVGFQFNVTYLNSHRKIIAVVLMILLSILGKIIGTLAACHYLKIPTTEGIFLALLLNLKGHAELLILGTLPQSIMSAWQDQNIHNLAIIVVVLDTVITGPAVAYILRIKEKYFAHKHTSLESSEPESELRMLACVFGSRHLSSKIGLIWALSGSLETPITAYLIHLVELPKKRRKKNLMYHQLRDGDQFSDEEDYGGNDVLEINDALDAFTMESKLMIHQRKVVSSFARMYEDICDGIEDLRVSIIFLTFHKHQRLDGKMENGKEGMRSTNQKVLRHAPCSVGIFVDRGQTGFQLPSSQLVQNVAALFFGGPDDREALACSKRIAAHPHINLTLIHFLPSPSSQQNECNADTPHRTDEILMEISNHEMESEIDKAFVEDFYNRYVAAGKVGYVQKYVDNGMQVVAVLKDIGEMYTLFIVGKGGRGHSPITTGMSDWEECPELGTIGDLLASSEFNINGSVLVIQQHRHSRNDLRDD